MILDANAREKNPMLVITGIAGGLGSYLAHAFAAEMPVVGTYHRSRPEFDPPLAGLYPVDVTSADSVAAFVEAARPHLSRIVLVNLAGVSIDGMGHKMPEATWDSVLDTNLKGTFLMCRALLPLMRAEHWGRIITVSSVVGQMGIPGTAAYASSKAGLFGLTRTLAAENAHEGITANTLALGYFNAGMINVIKPEIQARIREKIPMQRFGEPREFEQAVRFIIDCGYLTGSTISINGGLV
jgi:NAD(P)-dependent dehydrogenase (short-subunit alcohol dehydrogenase family)